MTAFPHRSSDRRSAGVLATMRTAGAIWFSMLAFPFLLFAVAVVVMNARDDTRHLVEGWGVGWFVFNMVYLAVAVPLAFLVRGRLFRPYYAGHRVEPKPYLQGMVIVWAALEIGLLLSIIAAYWTGAVAAQVLPAMVAFVLLLTQWPKGSAMVRPTGDDDDFEHYEEPR